MDARYERAGTIGFRCAADVPAPAPCADKVCGTFDAPNAFTNLDSSSASDWLAFHGAASSNGVVSVKKAGGSGNIKTPSTSNLQACAVTPVSVSWTDGPSSMPIAANVSNAACHIGKQATIQFNVDVTEASQTLHVVAGTYGMSPWINATVANGNGFYQQLNITENDAGVWETVTWSITVASPGTVSVMIGGAAAPVPPPPPPPPPLPPCKLALCGSFIQSTSGTVSLTTTGGLDWLQAGENGWTTFARKKVAAGDAPIIISDLVPTSRNEQQHTYGNNPTSFTWTDGEPPFSSSAGSTKGIYTDQSNEGMAFNVTIPGGDAAKGALLVYVYVGVFQADATFTATIAGTTGATYTDSSVRREGRRGTNNDVYMLRIPAVAEGGGGDGDRTLECRWLHSGKGSGNINFQAIAVQWEGKTIEIAQSQSQGSIPQVFVQAAWLS